MDDNFDDKHEEFPEHIENAAEEAGEQISQAAESAWNHVEDAAEEAGEKASELAEVAIDQVQETTEEAVKVAEEAFEEARVLPTELAEKVWDGEEVLDIPAAEQPNKDDPGIHDHGWEHVDETVEETVDAAPGTWSKVPGKREHEHTYDDQHVPDISADCCEPDPLIDSRAAAEFASSPIGLGTDMIGPTITANEVRSMRMDHIAESRKEAQKQKDFPVWAIILIILLVLCLCVLLPVLLVFGGGFAIFRDLFGSFGGFLPYLFV
ncbi:MAG: hypothetical protein PHW11_06720 [Anaerolineaceae bacterium]|mgnify:CR=1 FL=1|jgi:hypothetical protein|nr:hypothetical protein [Anaerolineaceae bacterium]MDD4042319.1 hypothetical protein [Anaerolineaceae bacterium]MDD4577738.1 hypothetical protein [Anaerolineaceae bacterium]